jgi:hypothetical protein
MRCDERIRWNGRMDCGLGIGGRNEGGGGDVMEEGGCWVLR